MDEMQKAFEKWFKTSPLAERMQRLREAIGGNSLGKSLLDSVDAGENSPMNEERKTFYAGFEAGKSYTVKFLKGRIKPSKYIKG